MSKKNTDITYTATLTLSQKGLTGDVMSTLVFDPRVAPDDNTSIDDVPPAYVLASVAAESFLRAAGILDDDGQLVDEDELHSTVNIDASTHVRRKLN